MNKMTNQEKWDSLMIKVKECSSEYCESIFPEKVELFYLVNPNGSIHECFITGRHYSFEFNTFYSGKNPTKKDVQGLYEGIYNTITYIPERIYYDYYYIWDKEEGRKASTAIKGVDLFSEKCYRTLQEAEVFASSVISKNIEDKNFDELHKKDARYDYRGNGYKDLGWQNSWEHYPMGKDGNVITDESKTYYFGYRKEDYPEYHNCRRQKHRVIDFSHNNRGTQHDVSCPICKLLWKYDSSD